MPLHMLFKLAPHCLKLFWLKWKENSSKKKNSLAIPTLLPLFNTEPDAHGDLIYNMNWLISNDMIFLLTVRKLDSIIQMLMCWRAVFLQADASHERTVRREEGERLAKVSCLLFLRFLNNQLQNTLNWDFFSMILQISDFYYYY